MVDVADRLARLHGLRLPALDTGAVLADVAAAFAAGLLLAILVVLLARAFLRPADSPRRRLLADLAGSRTLPREERLLAQARLLRRLAAEIEEGEPVRAEDWPGLLDQRLGTDFFTAGAGARLREALYRRDAALDPESIDRELTRLLRRTRLRP
ncbi:protein of unknown function [Tistlia consotensis]|uniref:DUF4381 domain-containing protein n=1 Tax=Tistlia consotensis USBA 355 TaxID=560819 RepID=A0A1Y6C9L4_9PROT|nr:DUF4381 family protein [Tistlia consotensis]SMF51841.1 protein of unknown function [Tistlia consotensis USBA 355]SNR83709.1 protein of unknown function [Tistlia consotensis]